MSWMEPRAFWADCSARRTDRDVIGVKAGQTQDACNMKNCSLGNQLYYKQKLQF